MYIHIYVCIMYILCIYTYMYIRVPTRRSITSSTARMSQGTAWWPPKKVVGYAYKHMCTYMYLNIPTRRSINLSMAYVARHSMEATKKSNGMPAE